MFTEEIKTRLPVSMKKKLEARAARKNLKVADVVREALQLFLTGHPNPNRRRLKRAA